GPEHLVGVDVHLRGDAGEQGGRDLAGERVGEPLPRRCGVALVGALGHGIVHQPDDPLVVGGVDGGRVVGVAGDGGQAAAPLVQDDVAERVVVVVVDKDVVGAHADLAAVDQAGRGDVAGRAFEVGGGVDDDRVLAAQLQGDRGQVVGGILGDGFADARRAGEEQVVVGEPGEVGAAAVLGAGDGQLVDGEVGGRPAAQHLGGVGGDRGGADHHAVAGGQRGAGGDDGEVEREVPGTDDPDDALGVVPHLLLEADLVEGAGDAGGLHPLLDVLALVVQVRHRGGDVREHGERLGPGAVVLAHRLGELVSVVQDEPLEAQDPVAADLGAGLRVGEERLPLPLEDLVEREGACGRGGGHAPRVERVIAAWGSQVTAPRGKDQVTTTRDCSTPYPAGRRGSTAGSALAREVDRSWAHVSALYVVTLIFSCPELEPRSRSTESGAAHSATGGTKCTLLDGRPTCRTLPRDTRIRRPVATGRPWHTPTLDDPPSPNKPERTL